MNKINISDEDKQCLIEAVQTSIGVSTTEFVMENNFITYNCIHLLKWDKINTSIANSMSKEDYEITKFDRGIFCPILIYNKKSKNLYLPMRPKNLLKLKNDRNKRNTPHYLDALVTKNKNITVEKKQQEFFDTDKVFDDEAINKILMPISDLEIENFIVCTFEEIKRELVSFKALILDTNLREYHIEDWSGFISPTYNTILEVEPVGTYNNLDISIRSTSNLDINKKVKIKEEKYAN